jgi:hypothetical protein
LFLCLSLFLSACSPDKSSKAGEIARNEVKLAYDLCSEKGTVTVDAEKPITRMGKMECTTENGKTTCTKKDDAKFKCELKKVELCNELEEECEDFKFDETLVPCEPSDNSKGACRLMSLKGEQEKEAGAGTKTEQEKREEIINEIRKQQCATDNGDCLNDVGINELLEKVRDTTKTINKDEILNKLNSIIIEKEIDKLCGADNITECKDDANMKLCVANNIVECKDDVKIKGLVKKLEDITKRAKKDEILNTAKPIIFSIKRKKNERKIIVGDINKLCKTDGITAACNIDADMNALFAKVENINDPIEKGTALANAESIITKIKKEKNKRGEIENKIYRQCNADDECKNHVKIKGLVKKVRDITKSVKEEEILNRANSIIIENNINERCGTYYITECKNNAEMQELLKKVRNINSPADKKTTLAEADTIIARVKILADEKEETRVMNSLETAVKEAVDKMPEVTGGLTFYKSNNLSEGVAKVKDNMKNMMDEAAKKVTSTTLVKEMVEKWAEQSTSSMKEFLKVKAAEMLVAKEDEAAVKAREEAEKDAEDWIRLKAPTMLKKLQEAVALVRLIKAEAEKKALRSMGKSWHKAPEEEQQKQEEETPEPDVAEQMAARMLVIVSVEEMLKKARVEGMSKKDRDARNAKTTLTPEEKADEDVMQMMRRIAWGAKAEQ